MNEKKENVIVNGFFWRFAERCGVQLISAVVSILLARILTPDDYGKGALVYLIYLGYSLYRMGHA